MAPHGGLRCMYPMVRAMPREAVPTRSWSYVSVRYSLVLALVVLLALAPPAVASAPARVPTAQAGQLWLLVLEPTAAFAPGADEPAWVAEPGEWYWVINRNAARDRTGAGVWALAAWEFDPPSAAVLIRLDERVQQFLEPAPPPPPPPSPPPTSTRPEPTPTAIPVSCTTQSARSSPLAVIPPGQVYLTANGFAPFASVSWTAIAMPAGGFLDPPTTTTAANALCTATQTINMGPDAPAGTWTLRASGTGYGGQPLALTVSFVVQSSYSRRRRCLGRRHCLGRQPAHRPQAIRT